MRTKMRTAIRDRTVVHHDSLPFRFCSPRRRVIPYERSLHGVSLAGKTWGHGDKRKVKGVESRGKLQVSRSV